MVGLIIGLLIFVIGLLLLIFLHWEFLGTLFCVLSFVFILFHTPTWLLAERKYELTVIERNSIIETLEVARAKENNLELASITKEIIEFNKELAMWQYNNSTELDCYIDDRIMNLKPIK